jgi:GNAT superfamily N-acetyltransferase
MLLTSGVLVVVAVLLVFAWRTGPAPIVRHCNRFKGRTATVRIWGDSPAEFGHGEQLLTRVWALGAGLHFHLKLADGPSRHVKVAQPRDWSTRESSLIIGTAKYVQVSGSTVRRVIGQPAFELTVRAPRAFDLRPFRPDDAAAVSALIATTMQVSNAADYPAELIHALIAYFTPEKVTALAGERDCLVASVRADIIGTAARDVDELVTFFVHPDWQGRGVGAALLAELERSALRAGLKRLRVEASVTGAGFYERQGYQRTGPMIERTAGAQVPMSKDLDAT